MSRIYSAGQYEQDYLPHRLGNWAAPDVDKARAGTLRAKAPGEHTQFIVDERGHLLPGVPKVSNAFSSCAEALGGVPTRWPLATPVLPAAPAATMGYKGISSDYLPASTVTIKTVELPGCKERLYQ